MRWPWITRKEHERRMKAVLIRLDAAIDVIIDTEKARS